MPTGTKQWVCNVYIPPAQNLAKRHIVEQEALEAVEEIAANMPATESQTICGDFNTRVANMSPCVGDVTIARNSMDRVKCNRADWLIALCARQGVHMLNGATPGPPAQPTFHREGHTSVVDYMLSSQAQATFA